MSNLTDWQQQIEDRLDALEALCSKKQAKKKALVDADAAFLAALKVNPAYAHLDLEVEMGKMRQWLLLPKAKGRKMTKQFMLNWLNKQEAPLKQALERPKQPYMRAMHQSTLAPVLSMSEALEGRPELLETLRRVLPNGGVR